MLKRLAVGLLKGLVLGALVGAVLFFGLGVTSTAGWMSLLPYLLYGAVVALTGVFSGQPPWRPGAWVASILKAVVGFAVGAGLYALVAKFLGASAPQILGIAAATPLAAVPLFVAPMIAAVYGALIELDDGGAPEPEARTGVRADGGANAITASEDEAEIERSSGASAGRAKRQVR